MRAYVMVQCKARTQMLYRTAIDLHIVPALGTMAVKDVGSKHVIELHGHMRDTPAMANERWRNWRSRRVHDGRSREIPVRSFAQPEVVREHRSDLGAFLPRALLLYCWIAFASRSNAVPTGRW
ncbi:MAG: hypothetical protein OXU42_16655 [Deltaproteobacteria bacterium]|nr:hypothetical protein [Deltaproteobacteria bacterium]